MRIVIVYESLFGNTRALAEEMASALEPAHQVGVLAAAGVTEGIVAAADLIVVGAPTHVHGLSRDSTRRSTMKQGVPAETATARGVREMLASLPRNHGTAAAAFDTKAKGPRWLVGAASKPIAQHLRRLGFRLVARPESFVVVATAGPLRDGERERARAWVLGVAQAAAAQRGPLPAAT